MTDCSAEIPTVDAENDATALADIFRREGAVVVRGLFDPGEIAAIRREVSALEEQVVVEGIEGPDNNWRGETLWALYGLIDRIGSDYRALLGHPGLLGICEAILGPGFSWMARSAATIKRDGEGAAVNWHRDWQDCPEGMDRARFASQSHLIACTVPLDPYTRDNCFWYFPGSHLLSLDEAQALAKGKRKPFSTEGARPLIAEPGDLIIHDYWVMHGSPAVGPGARGRRGLVVAYWSRELAHFTQARFPQYDLELPKREALIATAVDLRQTSPWNRGAAAFSLPGNPELLPEAASLRTPYWHYAYYAPDAERDFVYQ